MYGVWKGVLSRMISRLLFNLFLKSKGMSYQEFYSIHALNVLNTFPCACEDVGDDLIKHNEHCPRHGKVAQFHENVYNKWRNK